MNDNENTSKKKFVKVKVEDKGTSLMACGGGSLCNESK